MEKKKFIKKSKGQCNFITLIIWVSYTILGDKVKLIIDENIVFFLNKIYLDNMDLKDENPIEKKLIKLINKIQKQYNIDLSGYYNVYIYKDKNYGLIIEMEKEKLDYLDYFNNQIELNIEIIEDTFLYKIDNIFTIDKTLLEKLVIYINKDEIYIKIKENINDIELGKIIENSQIIYGNKAKLIKKQSKIIRM